MLETLKKLFCLELILEIFVSKSLGGDREMVIPIFSTFVHGLFLGNLISDLFCDHAWVSLEKVGLHFFVSPENQKVKRVYFRRY
jgi:hypothetical protein